MTVVARYQLNGDDVLTCLDVHDASIRNNFFLSLGLSVTILAIGALWLFLPGPNAGPWATIAIGAVLLAVGVVQRTFLARRLRWTASQSDPVELQVADDGVVAIERGSRSEVAWSRFVRLRESEHHFLLYKSLDIYSIVPKRGFASGTDLDTFRSVAMRGIDRAREAVEQADAADEVRDGT